MPLLSFEGVQVAIAPSRGAQLAFSATGELTIRCSNFTGDVVLSAVRPEPTPVAPSPSSSAASHDHDNNHRRVQDDALDASSVSESDDSGVHVATAERNTSTPIPTTAITRTSSVVALPQKRRRLEALKRAKKAKLSTLSRPPRPRKPQKATNASQNKRHPVATVAIRQATPWSPVPAARVDALTYFQCVVDRETLSAANGLQEASEDFCFLCRDGGVLLECDWHAGSPDARRCPKVYHEECLGYAVPESLAVWNCPRHRCQLCGQPAKYACRFCVSSYCREHVPREAVMLGPASRDLPGTTYVLCATCAHEARRALETGKLSSNTYALVLRPPRVAPY